MLKRQIWPGRTQTLLARSGEGLREAAPNLDGGGLGVAVGRRAALDAVAGDGEHGVRLQALHAALAARLESLRIGKTSVRAFPALTAQIPLSIHELKSEAAVSCHKFSCTQLCRTEQHASLKQNQHLLTDGVRPKMGCVAEDSQNRGLAWQ